MKRCLSPHKKYILTTLIAPIFIVALLIFLHQFKALAFLSSLFFFIAFIGLLSLFIYSISISCPKCKQKIACNKDGCCFAPFDMSALDGIVWHHCKQCSYDLNRCEEI
jgi:hypothetical protein